MNFIDGHCDTITTALALNQSLNENNLHLDFERLKKTGNICQFFAIWLDKNLYNKGFENTKKAIDFFDKQILNTYVKKALSYNEVIKNYNDGFISGIVTVEGGEALEGNIDNLKKLHDLGVRLITLCWNYENELGFGATTKSENGLKDFGMEVIKKMNELNMIIDVSHLNEAGFWDVYEKSNKAFIATHSNAFHICRHCRNLNDSQLKAIAEKGGVIGLNLYPNFLNESGNATIYDILKHTEYIINLIGDDYLTLGCDFDGIDKSPENINTVVDLKYIYEIFCKEFGEKISDKIFYKNYMEFLKNNL